jgi:hypothetical protein
VSHPWQCLGFAKEMSMSQSTVVSVLRQYATPVLYEQACAAAGVPVPSSQAEAARFAERCIASAKVKADLFEKASPTWVTRAKALETVAGLCWFPSWHAMTEYAKRFPTLSERQRAQLRESYWLATAAWVLQPGAPRPPVVQAMLATRWRCSRMWAASSRGLQRRS